MDSPRMLTRSAKRRESTSVSKITVQVEVKTPTGKGGRLKLDAKQKKQMTYTIKSDGSSNSPIVLVLGNSEQNPEMVVPQICRPSPPAKKRRIYNKIYSDDSESDVSGRNSDENPEMAVPQIFRPTPPAKKRGLYHKIYSDDDESDVSGSSSSGETLESLQNKLGELQNKIERKKRRIDSGCTRKNGPKRLRLDAHEPSVNADNYLNRDAFLQDFSDYEKAVNNEAVTSDSGIGVSSIDAENAVKPFIDRTKYDLSDCRRNSWSSLDELPLAQVITKSKPSQPSQTSEHSLNKRILKLIQEEIDNDFNDRSEDENRDLPQADVEEATCDSNAWRSDVSNEAHLIRERMEENWQTVLEENSHVQDTGPKISGLPSSEEAAVLREVDLFQEKIMRNWRQLLNNSQESVDSNYSTKSSDLSRLEVVFRSTYDDNNSNVLKTEDFASLEKSEAPAAEKELGITKSENEIVFPSLSEGANSDIFYTPNLSSSDKSEIPNAHKMLESNEMDFQSLSERSESDVFQTPTLSSSEKSPVLNSEKESYLNENQKGIVLPKSGNKTEVISLADDQRALTENITINWEDVGKDISSSDDEDTNYIVTPSIPKPCLTEENSASSLSGDDDDDDDHVLITNIPAGQKTTVDLAQCVDSSSSDDEEDSGVVPVALKIPTSVAITSAQLPSPDYRDTSKRKKFRKISADVTDSSEDDSILVNVPALEESCSSSKPGVEVSKSHGPNIADVAYANATLPLSEKDPNVKPPSTQITTPICTNNRDEDCSSSEDLSSKQVVATESPTLSKLEHDRVRPLSIKNPTQDGHVSSSSSDGDIPAKILTPTRQITSICYEEPGSKPPSPANVPSSMSDANDSCDDQEEVVPNPSASSGGVPFSVKFSDVEDIHPPSNEDDSIATAKLVLETTLSMPSFENEKSFASLQKISTHQTPCQLQNQNYPPVTKPHSTTETLPENECNSISGKDVATSYEPILTFPSLPKNEDIEYYSSDKEDIVDASNVKLTANPEDEADFSSSDDDDFISSSARQPKIAVQLLPENEDDDEVISCAQQPLPESIVPTLPSSSDDKEVSKAQDSLPKLAAQFLCSLHLHPIEDIFLSKSDVDQDSSKPPFPASISPSRSKFTMDNGNIRSPCLKAMRPVKKMCAEQLRPESTVPTLPTNEYLDYSSSDDKEVSKAQNPLPKLPKTEVVSSSNDEKDSIALHPLEEIYSTSSGVDQNSSKPLFPASISPSCSKVTMADGNIRSPIRPVKKICMRRIHYSDSSDDEEIIHPLPDSETISIDWPQISDASVSSDQDVDNVAASSKKLVIGDEISSSQDSEYNLTIVADKTDEIIPKRRTTRNSTRYVDEPQSELPTNEPLTSPVKQKKPVKKKLTQVLESPKKVVTDEIINEPNLDKSQERVKRKSNKANDDVVEIEPEVLLSPKKTKKITSENDDPDVINSDKSPGNVKKRKSNISKDHVIEPSMSPKKTRKISTNENEHAILNSPMAVKTDGQDVNIEPDELQSTKMKKTGKKNSEIIKIELESPKKMEKINSDDEDHLEMKIEPELPKFEKNKINSDDEEDHLEMKIEPKLPKFKKNKINSDDEEDHLEMTIEPEPPKSKKNKTGKDGKIKHKTVDSTKKAKQSKGTEYHAEIVSTSDNEEIARLPEHFLKDLAAVKKQNHTTKIKKTKMQKGETKDKSISVNHGSTEFSAKMAINCTGREQLSGNFKQQLLYGSQVRRCPSQSLKVTAMKRKF